MDLAICFTNFGPYHLARLRALAAALGRSGGRLIAYEVAAVERRYPWRAARAVEPFEWVTFFPDRAVETIPRACLRGRSGMPSTATGPTPWRSSATRGPSRWPRSAGRSGRGGRRS